MKIGLALSGGGARGIAHLGALKALDEFGIKPAMISGVSSGAIIGTLYAAGMNPDTILENIIKERLYRYVRPAWSKFGFLKMERFVRVYERYLPAKNFEQLKIKLFISAADLQEAKTIYFSEGELLRPLLASSCMPILFVPMAIGNKRYVDGGILNNLPVEPLLGHTDFIIGIHCNPTNKSFEMHGIKSMIERTFHLSLALNVKERIKHCDIFIEPPMLSSYTIFDLAHARDIFQIGYEYSLQALAKAEDLMKKHHIRFSKI
jgi:NTE family protein